MSDLPTPPAVAVESSDALVPVSGSQHAGGLIRSAREAQGMHIGALAVTLKVPVKKLEALEAGRFQELPDLVFVRSLALSVCRALKLDPAAVLALLPSAPEYRIVPVDHGLHAEFKDVDATAGFAWRSQALNPLMLGALLIGLAIAGVLLWNGTTGSSNEPVAVLEDRAPVQTATPAPLAPLFPPDATPPTDGSAAAPVVAQDTGNVTAQPLVGTTRTAATAPAAAAAGADSRATEIRARGVSWLEVLDAKGAVQLRRFTSPGEVIALAGQRPLAITLGKADQVEVVVAGTPLDLRAQTRQNVAKFEVK